MSGQVTTELVDLTKNFENVLQCLLHELPAD
jgi:hypothetical protein